VIAYISQPIQAFSPFFREKNKLFSPKESYLKQVKGASFVSLEVFALFLK